MCNLWKKYQAKCGHEVWMDIFDSCADEEKDHTCRRLVVHHSSCCPPDKLTFDPNFCAGCQASSEWIITMTQRYLNVKKLDLPDRNIADFDAMHFELMEWPGVPYITKNAIHRRVMRNWVHNGIVSNIATEMVRAGACTAREADSEYREFWARP